MVGDERHHTKPENAPHVDDHPSEAIEPEAYDELVHGLFAASLDLHAALALVNEGPAAEKIRTAIDSMDQTINQLRRATFGLAHTDGVRPRSQARSSA